MPSQSVLNAKKSVVSDLAIKIKNAKSFILVDYRGLTVEQDTVMRKEFRDAGLTYKIYKNTLTKLALKENNLEGLDGYLEGPTAIAFSDSDPILPSKLLSDYAKKFEKFGLKAGVVEGKVVDVKGIKSVAEIPSKEELIAKMLGSFNAPISGFVNVLNGNLRGLVVALNAIAEKKK